MLSPPYPRRLHGGNGPALPEPYKQINKESRIRNCCADPARNKLCHTGTARKASVPVMILCRNSITDTGADGRRPCEAVRSDSCTFFLLKCPAEPFRRIGTSVWGTFLLFFVCHRITLAGGDVNNVSRLLSIIFESSEPALSLVPEQDFHLPAVAA